MAFGILNYAFGIVMFCAFICTVVLLQRYLQHRNNITLIFGLFMAAYTAAAGTYFFRGFFVRWDPIEMLLWRIQNYLWVVMSLSLTLFLLYPLIQEQRKHRSYHLLIVLFGIILIVSITNVFLISTLGIDYTYTDYYGVEHYAFEYPPGSDNYLIYYYTLAADVMVANIGLILLGISYRRETEMFYKRRAFLILLGMFIVVYGQLFLLSNAFAILTPFTSIPGTLLLSLGVVSSRK